MKQKRKNVINWKREKGDFNFSQFSLTSTGNGSLNCCRQKSKLDEKTKANQQQNGTSPTTADFTSKRDGGHFFAMYKCLFC